jgi:hypothetical protein
MRYQQPYGVSDPNAAYVNGNPVTGTMGSIPPAAAIEYDMREIMEVISRANSRGYKDFADVLCAAGNDADLQQLRKAIEGFVRAAPAVFNDLIDSYVTFTVHGAGANFTDLNAALHYLSKYKITQHGRVTLQLAGAASGTAQQFVYNEMIIFDHPNNDRIFVRGKALLAAVPTSAASYTLTGNGATARNNDTIANRTMLRTKFATELFFNNGAGIEIIGRNLGAFDAILLVSSGAAGSMGFPGNGITVSASDTDVDIAHMGGTGIVSGVGIVGFPHDGLYVGQGGNLTMWGIGFPLVTIGNAGSGVNCNGNGKFQPVGIVLSYSNTIYGDMANVTSTIYFDVTQCHAAYNAQAAVLCAENSTCTMNGAQFWGNGTFGVYVNQEGSFAATGLIMSLGGVFNGAAWELVAEHGSAITVGGILAHQSRFSPALNTNANNNSWITTS